MLDNNFRRSGFEVSEHVRRFLQGETDSWLRIEEYRDGTTQVVRADIASVDPDNDVDITVTDNTLHIVTRREKKQNTRTRPAPGQKSATASSPAASRCPRSANQEEITAAYVDGFLEIRVVLPEQPEASSSRIRISRSTGPSAHQSPDALENYIT